MQKRVVFLIKLWPRKDSDQNVAHSRKKTAGYHLFRNVLPECNPILGSQLTAAATQLFSRDVQKRLAYVLCFSTRTKVSHTLARTRTVSFSANGLVVMASPRLGISHRAVIAAVAPAPSARFA